jgi:hypothetical protein
MNWNTNDYTLQTEASCLIFAFALRNRLDRIRSRSTTSISGLDEFDADKTLRFLDKLWAARDVTARPTKLLHFPVIDIDDKHGHRIAFAGRDRQQGGKKKSVLDSMIAFDRQCQPASRTLKLHRQDYDWGTAQLIEPQITGSDLARLYRSDFLGDRDARFLELFGSACGMLEEPEIIAIGRHESPEATRNSLLWEFSRWLEWAQTCIEMLSQASVEDQHKKLADAVWQCWSFARECKLKAREERSSYEVAYQKFSQEVRDFEEISSAFHKAQNTADVIWDSHHVTPLAFPAYYCSAFAIYMAGCLSHLEGFADSFRRPSITEEDTELAFSRLQYFNSVDPANRPMNFDPNHCDWRPSESGPADTWYLIQPRELWNGTEQFERFLNCVTKMLDYIHRTYLESDLMRSRITQG